MDGYLKNNIGFRYSTASQYGEFYRAKAFLLGEVLSSPSHEFSCTAREILLQYLSYATDWLMESEKDFIRSTGPESHIAVSQRCAETFMEMDGALVRLMQNNPQDFEEKFSAVWSDLSRTHIQNIATMIISRQAESREEAFAFLVDFLIGFMNHALYCLHEIDYLFNRTDIPFLHLDRFDVAMRTTSGINSPATRVGIYKAHGLVGEEQSGFLKPNLDTRYVSSDPKRQASYKQIVSELATLNFD